MTVDARGLRDSKGTKLLPSGAGSGVYLNGREGRREGICRGNKVESKMFTQGGVRGTVAQAQDGARILPSSVGTLLSVVGPQVIRG